MYSFQIQHTSPTEPRLTYRTTSARHSAPSGSSARSEQADGGATPWDATAERPASGYGWSGRWKGASQTGKQGRWWPGRKVTNTSCESSLVVSAQATEPRWFPWARPSTGWWREKTQPSPGGHLHRQPVGAGGATAWAICLHWNEQLKLKLEVNHSTSLQYQVSGL